MSATRQRDSNSQRLRRLGSLRDPQALVQRRSPGRRQLSGCDLPRPRRPSQVHREIIAAAHHDLRTPLTSIVGYTEVLLDGDAGPLTDPQRIMLEHIDTNCTRLASLVREVLGEAVEGQTAEVTSAS